MAKIGREARHNMAAMKKDENELSRGYTAAEIAQKWGRDEGFAAEQLADGQKIEMEHTDDPDTANTIASQHLYKESIDYYIELVKMEKKFETNNPELKPVMSDDVRQGEMEYLDKMLKTFTSFLNLDQQLNIGFFERPGAENPEAMQLVAMIQLNETKEKIYVAVNEQDSGDIDVDLPNGKGFSGSTDDAANYVNKYFEKATTRIVPDIPVTEKEPEIPETPEEINFKNKIDRINHIKKLIDEKGDDIMKYSEAELMVLRTYEGMGGQQKNVTGIDLGLLDQFYTPYRVIEKMWGLAMKHGFSFNGKKHICEPSCGIGRFFEYIPEGHAVSGYEIDKYAFTIAKLTFPKFEIINLPFETHFWDIRTNIKKMVTPEYDLFIGNPPYKKLEGGYVVRQDVFGKTEKDYTQAETFDQYMLMRGVDLLFPGGLLIFIIPNNFMANSTNYNVFKNLLASKADLIDAYRLPNGVFAETGIGTDIVVFKKK